MPTVYRFGPFRLEVEERRLSRSGEPVRVAGKAFELLARLAAAPGRLLSHEELLRELWPDVVVEPNNIAHNVSILRKILDGVPEVEIETVPRQGYRLLAQVEREPSPVAARGGSGAGVDPPEQRIAFCRGADGTRLAYARHGTGAPIIKVAHWLSHLELDWQSSVWRHWLALLARQGEVLRYDARGNGLSEWDLPEIRFADFVDDLEAVLDAAGVERAPLVGISQGAAVAVDFAVRQPQRVSALVLVGGCARGWRVKGRPKLDAHFEALMTLVANGWGQDNPAFRQIFTTAFFPQADPELLDAFNELQRRTASPDNARSILGALGDVDVREHLAEVRVPTLVLHSEGDAVIPMSDGVELAAGIPGARFVVLESANHLVLESEPAWRRLEEEIGRFLAEVATDGS